MRRLSDEDGFRAGARNWGRLALAFIPAALGGAVLVWILAAFGWIDLTHELRMEKRTMQSVGISEPPKDPIKVINHSSHCLTVDSSYIDGRKGRFYVKNICDERLQMPNYIYKVKAHDGTVIESGKWAFNSDRGIEPGERREQELFITDNDIRAETVELWMVE